MQARFIIDLIAGIIPDIDEWICHTGIYLSMLNSFQALPVLDDEKYLIPVSSLTGITLFSSCFHLSSEALA
jgi:hypothetical protein